MTASIRARVLATLTISALILGSAAFAQQSVGTVTKLSLPRFVSMKTAEAFARRGPGKIHRIDWKFVRRNMPLKVIAEHGHWRRVEDSEGKGGWIHYALLSRTRTVMVLRDELEMFAKPAGLSRLVAKLHAGVVGKLISCTDELCEIETRDAEGSIYRGWVHKTGLWGPVDAD